MQVDTLIHPHWLIPVEPDGLVLQNHALAVRDGRIADILPSEQARSVYSAAETLDLVEIGLAEFNILVEEDARELQQRHVYIQIRHYRVRRVAAQDTDAPVSAAL